MIKVFLAFAFFFALFFGLFKLSEIKVPKKSRTMLTKTVIYSIMCSVFSVSLLSLIVILF